MNEMWKIDIIIIINGILLLLVIQKSDSTTQNTTILSQILQGCVHNILPQERQLRAKQNLKPCCLPDVWKARFRVHTIRGGHYLSRLDHGAFLMRHGSDGNVQNALLVIGKRVYSTDFCSVNTTNHSNITQILCPMDQISCLNAPFLGEPRCITEKDGYTLKKTRAADSKGKIKQTWFIDKVNPIFGNIERHIYHVIRQYGLCQLIRYQIQWGRYYLPWRTCRLFLRMEQNYYPIPGSFRQNFKHSLTDDLLFC